jgi:RNA polymerase sigma-70 factor (ECF subfamily)
MTGSRAAADDLSQEALARAIEREADLADRSRLDGWLVRIATTVCLDHLRRERRERRATDLVDPIELAASPSTTDDPESHIIRRDDVRFAIVVALQALPPRQRAALVLHDVMDRPLVEVGVVLDVGPAAAKMLVHRARAGLLAARGRLDVDRTADSTVVERLAGAITSLSVDAVAALLADDVWGIVDGGDSVRVATKPSHGRRAVARRWANAARALAETRVAGMVRWLNGEPTVLVVLPEARVLFATVHVETRNGQVAALRVVRARERLAHLEEGLVA